jgi:hypothetical protein
MALAQITAGGSTACPSFAGANEYDSQSQLIGDPFKGGAWGNAAGGRAFAVRTLKSTAMIRGIYVGSAGSDITTEGSRIRIVLKRPDGTEFVALDLSGVAINRGFSPGRSGTVMGPLTLQFPDVPTRQITVEMHGNGWFLLDRTHFFLSRC